MLERLFTETNTIFGGGAKKSVNSREIVKHFGMKTKRIRRDHKEDTETDSYLEDFFFKR